MRAHALTLNAGSSSVKFGLFAIGAAEPEPRAAGVVEQIGGAPQMRARFAGESDEVRRVLPQDAGRDHRAALDTVLALLGERLGDGHIAVVGHRIVHGGPDHAEPVVLTPAIIAALARLVPFAPLHQPHNLAGVEAATTAFPGAPQIACFDTAFHRRHAFVHDAFGLPRAFYDKGLRRYGFHGLSYDFIQSALARDEPALNAGRMVVAHLGNGASMCGMVGGESVSSTMGFSPLDGLPMGTRCGQIDPGVLLYLMTEEGMDAAALADLLYNRSGLLGLSGISNDMRRLEASDAPEAAEAIAYFTTRIRREVAALVADLGGIDGLVFTGGIGENSAHVRAMVCEGLGWTRIILDEEANRRGDRTISREDSPVRVLVLPTDEEIVIARAAARFAP
ncbi:acetate/propionate family kinase [Faunimonas sp. B44]|uniref:acetate/propionate family kinase n=1 Tax=Faunimonas sp. B44 TaxID=3461493 RepID=UPI004044B657